MNDVMLWGRVSCCDVGDLDVIYEQHLSEKLISRQGSSIKYIRLHFYVQGGEEDLVEQLKQFCLFVTLLCRSIFLPCPIQSTPVCLQKRHVKNQADLVGTHTIQYGVRIKAIIQCSFSAAKQTFPRVQQCHLFWVHDNTFTQEALIASLLRV